MESVEPRIHEDHIAGKETHVLQYIPMLQTMLTPESKSNNGYREWKIVQISARNLAKIGNEFDVIEEARKRNVIIHFRH